MKVSLGAKQLDSLIGGGLEEDTITNVFGASGSGKTNLSIQAAVSCIKEGKSVIYIDAEGGFSIERFNQMTKGTLLDKVVISYPKNFKEQDKIIREIKNLVTLKKVGLIVVDSLVALYRIELKKEGIYEVNSKLIKQLSTLSSIAREKKIPVLVTNQVYSDFDTGDLELVGRDIPKYACKTLVKLEKIDWGKRKATIIKHRWKPEGASCEFEIKDEGIVDIEKKFGLF